MSHRIRNPQYLVGHWLPGRNDATDASGHGNDGTWSGTEAYADGPNSRGVGSFDGSSHVSIGDVTSLDGLSEWSVCAWFNCDDVTVAQDAVFSKWRSVGVGRGFLLDVAASQARFLCGTTGDASVTLAGGSPVSGQWHHLVGVKDAVNANLYLDGGFITSTANANAFPNIGVPMLVGANGQDAAVLVPFDGLIRHARIYNVALTGDEVIDVMEMDKL